MLLLPHSSPSKSCGQPRVKESDRKAYKIFLQPTTDSKVVPKTTEVKKEKKKSSATLAETWVESFEAV